MKPLSREQMEPQANNFGKRGKSLFGLACLFKLPSTWEGAIPEGCGREGDFLVYYVRVACDDSDQGFWHSVQVFTLALKLLKQEVPFITGGPLFSDGATNFKTLAFLLMLPEISKTTGISITEHILPEAGDGKDAVDRDFNAVNIAFNSFVKSPGAVMLNKDHIVEALEKAKGKKKGIINAGYNVDRPTDKVAKEWSDCLDTAAFAALAGCRTQEKGSKATKSKQDLYRMQLCWGANMEFVGMKFWAHYGHGGANS
jgi:hypothetical protein